MSQRSSGRRSYRLVSHYLVYPIVIVVTLLLVTFVSVRVLREAVFETHRRDLQSLVRIVRNVLPPQALDDRGAATEFCLRAALDTGVRITVIAADGTVLGDSHADAETMENHAGRPEVRRALDGEEGISVRYSATLRRDLIYAALPLYGNPPATDRGESNSQAVRAVVRGSLVVDDVETRLSTLYRRLIGPGVLLLTAAIAAAIVLSRGIRIPLREIHAAAVAYAGGDLDRPIDSGGPQELIELAFTFESMARQLQRRIQELDDQRRETEEVLDTIQEPLLLIDTDMRIQRYNEAAVRFFDIPEGKILDRFLLDLFRNSAVDAFIQQVRQDDRKNVAEITTFERPERHLRLWAAHLTNATSLLRDHTLLVIRDVTPEFHVNQMRKDFVANVSHELKTPLTMIQGAAETLNEIPCEDAPQRKRFEEMIASHATRMTKIVEDLLNLARIEQEERVIVDQDVSITQLLRECVTEITDGNQDVAITTDVPDGLTWRVHATLFSLAVKNLLDNAVRYGHDSRTEPITLSSQIVTQPSDRSENGETLVITVTDHGTGISDHEQDRIFERFYRVDRGRSRSHGGTGLGLSIVRHVARIHGGTASVESTLGEGSSFSITIPRGNS